MRKMIGILILVFFAASFNSLWAYEGKVHMKINEHAADPSNCSLDEVLREQLGIVEGVDAELKNGNETKTIKEWISFGGAAEDYGWFGKHDFPSTRAFNHFHDPLINWEEAGFDHELKYLYFSNYLRFPVSAILWGLNPGQQDFTLNFTGDWSWGKVRDYYYHALTGLTEEEKNEDFADCFRALGQVLHLLQDMSVPLHTRNDAHIFPLKLIPGTSIYIGKWNYETYTLEYLKDKGEHKLDFIPDQPGDHPDPILLTDPQPQTNPADYSHLPPVSGLFDRNQYNEGATSPPHDNTIGLAEYSNANFLTDDTMWKYQHPRKEDTTYQEIDWHNPEEVVAEDGDTDSRIYIKYKDGIGEDIDHLAAVDYWFEDYVDHVEIEHGFLLDKVCFKDYAAKLIPRAVGYSAGLLDYFFRGKIEISEVTELIHSTEDDILSPIVKIKAKVRNGTPDEEIVNEPDNNGELIAVARYTEAGETNFSISTPIEIETLDSTTLTEFEFDFSANPIPNNITDLILQMVYKGDLGNEEDIAIAVGMKELNKALEITYPERYVYAIIDGVIEQGETQQEFKKIKANVRSVTSKNITGDILAVAKYRKRINYQADLSGDPPTPESIEDFFSGSTSVAIPISSLPSSTLTEFEFDFTDDPIPVGITDLYLQVIYQVGSGTTVVAEGTKDLNEPMHICVFNSTDRFYLDSVLRTADEIKSTPALLARVDFDGDGVPNEPDEPYIDPFDLWLGVSFYPESGTPPDSADNYHAIWGPVPSGRYGRVIFLTDMPEFKFFFDIESPNPYLDWEDDYLVSGVINQKDDQGIFWCTQVNSFRGIIQHDWIGYCNVYPDWTGWSEAPWPDPVDNDPFPITTINP